MFSIDSAQIDAWIVAFIYPLTRILAFIATAPLWSNAGVPGRTRLILAIAITVAITPILPAMPIVQPASLAGLWILLQQMLIGIGMGFAAKIVFSGIELAGEFIGAQMGLGFATFYDPLSSSQTPVISEFINLIALLLFLSMNGHLGAKFLEYPGQCSATWCWILVKFSRTGRENILGGVAVGAPYSGRAADHQCCTRRINSSSPPTEYIRVRFPFNANRWIFWACSQPELSCDTATEYF